MYFVKESKGLRYLKRFDYPLFFTVIALTVFGYLVLRSAVFLEAGGSRILKTQLAAIVMGISFSLVLSLIDYKVYKLIGILFYAASIIMLILVIPFGYGLEEHGANSWFNIAGMSFQPSEIAKIGYVMLLAFFLERIEDDRKIKDIVLLLVAGIVPIGLVMLQPDMGTAFVFAFAFFIMVFAAGLPWKYVFALVGVVAAGFPLAWEYVFDEYQQERFKAYIDKTYSLDYFGFQQYRARLAIGSGRLTGYGLFNGVQTQSGTGLPVKESDYIFSVVGEELGFIGAAGLILLICIIFIRCIMIARDSQDPYGRYLVIGFCGILAFHFIENIGMNTGLLPVTGIPLPFVSAGGTTMLANYMAIGIILSVSMRRKGMLFGSEGKK